MNDNTILNDNEEEADESESESSEYTRMKRLLKNGPDMNAKKKKKQDEEEESDIEDMLDHVELSECSSDDDSETPQGGVRKPTAKGARKKAKLEHRSVIE